MSAPARLLDVLNDVANDRPFKTILAVTFTFDPEFFTSTGVLPALAGELDRTVATDDRAIEVARKERRRRVDSDVVRDRLGDPYIAVVQGYPSPSGPTPGWIDRYLWPTRRAGVLHAKCLLVAGEARAHAVITSANITEGSWCNNLEVAAAWSAPLTPTTAADRRTARAIADVADGFAKLAGIVDAPSLRNAARLFYSAQSLAGPSVPLVVWSGQPFDGKPLEHLERGEELVVTSPFWPSDENSARRVVLALKARAPDVTIVGRCDPGGIAVEVSDVFALAAGAESVSFGTALPPDTDGSVDDSFRQLHAKQVSVRHAGRWRSYVGSANATVQGLALSGRPNIELGVVVESPPLLHHTLTEATKPPPQAADPDDPDAQLDDPDGWDRYASALLDVNGTLRVRVEPAPGPGTGLEVPSGGPVRPLARRVEQKLQVEAEEVASLIRRSEVTVVTDGGRRLAVPVVLDDDLKLRVGGEGGAPSTSLDELLSRLARNPTGRPSDDAPGIDDLAAGDQPPGVGLPPPVPRKPVHRARDAIEVVTAAENPLAKFLAEKPPERLIELRLGGSGSIVDLARVSASTAGMEGGMTVVAAAFVVKEIGLLLVRLRAASPDTAPATARLVTQVETLAADTIRRVEAVDPVTARRLRRLGA